MTIAAGALSIMTGLVPFNTASVLAMAIFAVGWIALRNAEQLMWVMLVSLIALLSSGTDLLRACIDSCLGLL